MKINPKNRQQLLVLIAAAAVAVFAADRLLITPLSKSWRTRSSQIASLRQKVTEGRAQIQRERSLRERWEQMRQSTLPNNNSQAEQQVLKAFDAWAQRSRLTLLSISPQWKHDADEYMTLECRVEASGDLNNVSRFLYELERDPMALKLQAVEISSRDNDGQQFALGLQVSGLVLTPQPERATAQGRK